LLLLAAVLIGCTSPRNIESEALASAEPTVTLRPAAMQHPAAGPGSVHYAVKGYSVRNRPIKSAVLGDGRDVVLIMASIHGNEPAGTPLVEGLNLWLLEHPEELEGRTVVLMPVVNPDGMAARSRRNANNVDLNRNFPAANHRVKQGYSPSPLSEPESRIIMETICRHWPARVVSIHQGLDCIDPDGPAMVLAEKMADKCHLGICDLKTYPGSFGSFVGTTLGKPIITLELPRGVERLGRDELWKRYGEALLEAVRFSEPHERTDMEGAPGIGRPDMSR